MALPIKVHLPAELAVPARILARHLVNLVSRASRDDRAGGGALGKRGIKQGENTLTLAGIRWVRAGQSTASGGRQRVTEGREDEDEEDDHSAKEGGGDEVKQRPRARRATARRREVDMAHEAMIAGLEWDLEAKFWDRDRSGDEI